MQRLLFFCQPSVSLLSAFCQPSVSLLSAFCQPSVSLLSAFCQPVVSQNGTALYTKSFSVLSTDNELKGM
jgi:hypothetical protein